MSTPDSELTATSADVPDGRVGMLDALRHRDFALLWSGQALSSVGNQMFPIILSIAVLERHSGATGLGLVLAIQGLAFAGGTIVAASAGDRWRRTRQMISADAVRAVGVAALAVAPERVPGAAFLSLVVIVGVAEGLFLPAYGAVAPRVLPELALQGGNALNALSTYAAMVAGPAIAGALVATVGTGAAFWVDVLTFAFSLGTLLLIKETRGPAAAAHKVTDKRQRGLRDLAEGLRAIRDRPWIGVSICSATILMTFAVAPAYLAAPIVARQRLGGPAAYGLIFAVLGGGSILGSVLGGRIRGHRRGTIATCGLLTVFGAVGSLAILPLPLVAFFWAVAGAGVTIYQILWSTSLQRDVPDHLLGRVMALDRLGSQGLMPLGYAIAGIVVAAWGPRPLLLVGACMVLLVAPLPLLVPGGTTFATPPSRERPQPGPSELSPK